MTSATGRTCVYCGATDNLESINPNTVNMACAQKNLCTLRAEGHDPVQVALTLACELTALAWSDTEARNAEGGEGQAPALSDIDRMRLAMVLDAAARRLPPWGTGRLSELREQVCGEYGCRVCGNIGEQDCRTPNGGQVPRTHGTWGPRWHAGRVL
jgi:hypothetical protein